MFGYALVYNLSIMSNVFASILYFCSECHFILFLYYIICYFIYIMLFLYYNYVEFYVHRLSVKTNTCSNHFGANNDQI